MRPSDKRCGSAIIELSFCLPILVSLALATLQLGYSFFMYGRLEQAVRDACRYASLRNYASPNTTPDSAFLTAVKNAAVYGNPGGGSDPVAPNLTSQNISVTVNFKNGVPAVVTVAITNYILPQIIGSVPLTGKPSAQFPYLGIFMPI
jgi:Flp pilus assembly protein TadG